MRHRTDAHRFRGHSRSRAPVDPRPWKRIPRFAEESQQYETSPLPKRRAVSPPTLYKFRLFVADDTLNSTQASVNLAALCEAHLAGRHEIEIVDVLLEPKRALAEGVFLTPTLIKFSPLPVRRIVGTLSEPLTVLRALGLAEGA